MVIPKSTLSDHVTGKSLRAYARAPRSLSDEGDYLPRDGLSSECTLCWQWVMQEYQAVIGGPNFSPGLAQRKPQHLSRKRGQANDPAALNEWCEQVRKLFASSKLDKFDSEAIVDRLWNCDETVFCTAVASKQVLAKKGTKAVYEVLGVSI